MIENTRGKNGGKRRSGIFTTKELARLGMLAAVELAMWLLGLGQVPFGPLNMSFLTVPVAVGAILLGPAAGMILGGVFGLTSLIDAVTGKSVMTSTFFGISPVMTVLLCVGMRVLMGFCVGLISAGLKKAKVWNPVRFYVGAISAPLLNTLFFMGFICLFFYQTEFVQNLVAARGAVNPFHFVVLLVGVQGLIEAAVCCLVGGTVAQGVGKALRIK